MSPSESDFESARPQGHGSEPDKRISKPQSSHDSSRKRQRSAGVYSRKRGLTACQLCRGRKTKCDNARPSCSFCVSVHAACVYADETQGYVNFDSASIAIIERLDRVVGLLNTEFSKLHSRADHSTSSATVTFHNSASINNFSPAVPGAELGSPSPAARGQHVQDLGSTDQLRITPSINEVVEESKFVDIAAAHIVTETILQWPIFSGSRTNFEAQSLVLKHDTNYLESGQRQPPELENLGKTNDLQPRARIREEDFVHLCQNFLDNVHCKNPILDTKCFMRSAREVSENGLRWDGESCLVLLACALGAISHAFTPEDFDSDEQIHLLIEKSSKHLAEAYFDAARKRLGLLLPSLLTIQCFFFSGVYEMYCIRPLNAWFSFHQASVQFKVYLSAIPHLDETPYMSALNRRLEKRLYWSCMQSECELRVELRISASGLEQLDYPNAFPSPPAGISAEIRNPDYQSIGFAERSLSEGQERDEVRSWMYYLAETSLRRVSNRVATVLYQNGEDYWMRNIGSLVEQAQECASQLDLWISHVPPQIHLDETVPTSTNELALHLHSRHGMCRTWIYRPFLYFMTHASVSESVQLQAQIEPLAVKCLEYCMRVIFNTTYHHRHHGSWYTARNALSCALCILGGAKSGRVPLPENWHVAVERVVAILKIWEAESPNLRASRQKLEILHADVLTGEQDRQGSCN